MTVPCDHAAAVPVESVVTGEVLAALCPACGTGLPARFLGCPHDQAIDTSTLGERHQRRHCVACGGTWTEAADTWPAAIT